MITIQDYEKSVSFCELIRSDPQDLMNIKPITEWYDQIVKAIAEMQKRFRICSICNQNCEFNAELDEQIRTAHDMSPVKASKSGKDTLKAVLCRGCGRCICTKCMDMHADALKSAVDKTLYCVPCQIWNKRELASTEVYKAMSSDRVGAWVIGARNTLKAILVSLLEPVELLRKVEREGNWASRLGYLEELKSLPFGAVWDRYCEMNGVPVRDKWIAEMRDYEKNVLSLR